MSCRSFRSPAVSTLVAGCVLAAASGCTGTIETRAVPLAAGALPGGTNLSVEITTPADGAVVAPGPTPIEGQVNLGIGNVLKDTAVVYVIDVSSSTTTQGPVGCGADFNTDGQPNTILDCEGASILELDKEAGARGNVADVGVVVFGANAAVADLDPGMADAALSPPGSTNVETVLRSLRGVAGQNGVLQFTPRNVGGTTNYARGLSAALGVAQQSAASRKIIVMVSDGFASDDADTLVPVLGMIPSDTRVFTFAVGALARCMPTFMPGPGGTLQQIADAGGGTCTNVTFPDQLPDVLPTVIGSTLTDLEVTVDGVAVPVTSDLPVPSPGPLTLNFQAMANLAPGLHVICAAATGSDFGGEASVEECVTVTADDGMGTNQPPVLMCSDKVVPADAQCRASADIIDMASDPDGDALTCSETPPGPYGLGTTPVTGTCSDPDGASASCAATVKVVDVTPPDVMCPANQVLECKDGGGKPVFQPTATDNCSNVTPTCNKQSGSPFPIGSTQVTCTGKDGAGNADSCAFTVKVQDTKAPVLMPKPPIVINKNDGRYREIELSDCVTATDMCDGTLNPDCDGRIIKATSDERESGSQCVASGTCDDVVIVGPSKVKVRQERNDDGDGRVYTIHYEIKDHAGNKAAGTCKVMVPKDCDDTKATDSGCHLCVGDSCGTCPGPSSTCQ